jgi:HK97 family phage prohead protease
MIATAPPPSGLETKFIAFDQGAPRLGEAGRVAGYATLFGKPDQSGDIVMPGAFAGSLARRAAAGGSVKLLWQHDPARPIGVWDAVREDESGLWVEGRLLTGVQAAAEAAILLEAGAVDGLSIGYRVIRAERGPDGVGRRLVEIDLWEVSLVTFPMLPEARATTPGPVADDEVDLADALAAVLAQADA